MFNLHKKAKPVSKDTAKLPARWIRIAIPALVIIAWLFTSGIGGPYFGKISEVVETDLTSFLPKSAEATKANKQIEKFQKNNSISAVLVFEAEEGKISETQANDIKKIKLDVEEVDGIQSYETPIITSEDGKAAFFIAPIDRSSEPKDVLPKISDVLDRSDTSLKYKITGPASFAADLSRAFAGIDGILLLVALSVVFVILVTVYRSPFLPIIVLLNSIFALSTSILFVWYLASNNIITINGQVQGILFILVIGAATDYSLLYVSRYREELQKHSHAWNATIQALKGTIEPIIASGSTVIVGLLCLLLSDLASNKALGPVGAIGIAFAMVSALTFLPAILLLAGKGAFWPRMPKKVGANLSLEKSHPVWSKIGLFVKKYPRPIWLISLVVLVVAMSGVFQLKSDGVPQSDLILGKSEARDGQKIIKSHFPGGSGSPVNIIIPSNKLDNSVEIIEDDKGIDSVFAYAKNSPSDQKPLGREEQRIKLSIRKQIEEKFVDKNDRLIEIAVEQASPFKDAVIKEVEGKILLKATLSDAPDSDQAKQTIKRLRQKLHQQDSSILVGGITAAQLDTNDASNHDKRVIIPTILIAITIILMLLLRSILAPILLLFTTVLSFGTTLGIAAFLFNNVWKFPGADPSVVLFGFVFLVALGIDYNIFLMTRVREESLKLGTREGVIRGLVVTGGVITSAGIVLAATFAALAVIPILFLAQLAFIVAFGVLLDTTIVRSLLVPALVKDIGHKIWWPSSKHKD